MSETLITMLAGGVMLLGLAGVFLPVLPDISLIWAAALGYGLLVGWGRWGAWLFAGITVLALVAAAADVWASGVGARMGGASLWGIVGGLALALVGLVLFPPIGALAGLLLGTFLVEYFRLRSTDRALKATLGIGLGYGASFVVKLVLGLLMIAVWIVWLVVG